MQLKWLVQDIDVKFQYRECDQHGLYNRLKMKSAASTTSAICSSSAKGSISSSMKVTAYLSTGVSYKTNIQIRHLHKTDCLSAIWCFISKHIKHLIFRCNFFYLFICALNQMYFFKIYLCTKYSDVIFFIYSFICALNYQM